MDIHELSGVKPINFRLTFLSSEEMDTLTDDACLSEDGMPGIIALASTKFRQHLATRVQCSAPTVEQVCTRVSLTQPTTIIINHVEIARHL